MNFLIDERPGTDLPFVIVEQIRKYRQDLKAFATRGEAEDWVEFATYAESENTR